MSVPSFGCEGLGSPSSTDTASTIDVSSRAGGERLTVLKLKTTRLGEKAVMCFLERERLEILPIKL